MTTSEDRWRHQQSAAPHAPAHDALTPGLPLGNNPSWSEPQSSDAPSTAIGTGAPNPISGIVGTALLLILFGAPIFATMYPLTAAAAYVTWLVTNSVLTVATPLGADGRLVVAMFAGAIALWMVSRRDQELADAVPAYRYWRHIARLVLIGVFVATTSVHEFEHGFWPRSLGEVGVLLADVRFWIGMVVAAGIAHLLLKRADGIRAKWHLVLELFRLRDGRSRRAVI